MRLLREVEGGRQYGRSWRRGAHAAKPSCKGMPERRKVEAWREGNERAVITVAI
jgi:hypothetical protein